MSLATAAGSSTEASRTHNVCALCYESLLIPSRVEDEDVEEDVEDEGEPAYIIDDVELRCGGAEGAGPSSATSSSRPRHGHHFHWSCIVEHFKSLPDREERSRCPGCDQSVLDEEGKLVVDVRNEGGWTEGFDLGEEIDEELYLDSHPHIRLQRTFQSLMAQSNLVEAEELLANHADLGVNAVGAAGQTALHVCAMNDDAEGARFLLERGASKDIRDEQGWTPLEAARVVGAEKVVHLLAS